MLAREAKRAERRRAANARVTRPIPADERPQDPLLKKRGAQALEWLQAALMIGVAVFLHGVVLVAFFGASYAVEALKPALVSHEEKIEVSMVTPPPPPPPPPEPPPPPPEPEEAPKPKLLPKAAPPPPPDPINEPEKPPPEPPKEVRRVVGLSLESTTEGGGSGPSFAVGNTRMGNTERVATDAKQISELPKEPPKDAPPPTVNRVASRIPTGGTGPTLVKPKRKKPVTPGYPEMYRAQNLEADVVVEVTIDPSGKVKTARIVAPSPYAEFNEAAKAAAEQEEFSPAEKDGKPIEFTLTFTVRFRLND